MPVTALFLKVLRVVLEYGMLFWLLWFSVRLAGRVFGAMRRELQRSKPPQTAATEAVLRVIGDAEPSLFGKRFAFGEQIAIGRGDDNDIVVPEGFVSHHHAVIFRHANQYVVEDLGSVNPTYVNDCPLKGRAYLRPGDVLRIGMVTFRFER